METAGDHDSAFLRLIPHLGEGFLYKVFVAGIRRLIESFGVSYDLFISGFQKQSPVIIRLHPHDLLIEKTCHPRDLKITGQRLVFLIFVRSQRKP